MAASVIDKAFEGDDLLYKPQGIFEPFFDGIGLMRGTNAPLYRGTFGFVAASLALWALRPSFMFLPDGQARSFQFLHPEDSESTMIPWWVPGIIVGSYFMLFV